jgi:hypothetical protein
LLTHRFTFWFILKKKVAPDSKKWNIELSAIIPETQKITILTLGIIKIDK